MDEGGAAGRRGAIPATHWMRRSVLIHAVTRKGRGYQDDIPEATCYHAASGKLAAGAAEAEYPDRVTGATNWRRSRRVTTLPRC